MSKQMTLAITVDGKAVEVAPETALLAAARQAGAFIPTLCNHKALTPEGSCRMCLTEVTIGGRPFTLKKQLFDDLANNHMTHLVANLGRPLLILHSPEDQTVSIDNAYRIFEMARQPKSLVSLDGADHLLLDDQHARYAGALIAAWAARYIAD